jgi:hypothetical protein
MNRFLSIIPVFLLSHIFLLNTYAAYVDYKTLDPILKSAETFFISLRDNEYGTAWNLLSEKSHNVIIDDVYKASRKSNEDINKEDIIKDFNSRGMMSENYWNSFLRTFDADMILERSQWEMGFLRKDKAEIIITYNKSRRPATLKMHKEKNTWKVGLVETFWPRKALKLLHLFVH